MKLNENTEIKGKINFLVGAVDNASDEQLHVIYGLENDICHTIDEHSSFIMKVIIGNGPATNATTGPDTLATDDHVGQTFSVDELYYQNAITDRMCLRMGPVLENKPQMEYNL